MKFVINITYKDGDSFSEYTEHETLDYNWENEKVVVENMMAIKEHYEAFRAWNNRWYEDERNEECKKKWWYATPYCKNDVIDSGINLKLDDGSLVPYRCPWCSYFASLQDIELGFKQFKIEIN